eukprot:403355460
MFHLLNNPKIKQEIEEKKRKQAEEEREKARKAGHGRDDSYQDEFANSRQQNYNPRRGQNDQQDHDQDYGNNEQDEFIYEEENQYNQPQMQQNFQQRGAFPSANNNYQGQQPKPTQQQQQIAPIKDPNFFQGMKVGFGNNNTTSFQEPFSQSLQNNQFNDISSFAEPANIDPLVQNTQNMVIDEEYKYGGGYEMQEQPLPHLKNIAELCEATAKLYHENVRSIKQQAKLYVNLNEKFRHRLYQYLENKNNDVDQDSRLDVSQTSQYRSGMRRQRQGQDITHLEALFNPQKRSRYSYNQYSHMQVQNKDFQNVNQSMGNLQNPNESRGDVQREQNSFNQGRGGQSYYRGGNQSQRGGFQKPRGGGYHDRSSNPQHQQRNYDKESEMSYQRGPNDKSHNQSGYQSNYRGRGNQGGQNYRGGRSRGGDNYQQNQNQSYSSGQGRGRGNRDYDNQKFPNQSYREERQFNEKQEDDGWSVTQNQQRGFGGNNQSQNQSYRSDNNRQNQQQPRGRGRGIN